MPPVAPPPSLRRMLVVGGVGLGLAGAYLATLATVALTASPRPADLIVVLGNAVTRDGEPSPRLRARLDAALGAYRAGLAPRVLVSGGIEADGRDEAAVMAGYLLAHGAPPRAVLQDPRGVDTFETARNTAALLGGRGRVLVATQWFHVPRTELAMRRFGLGPVSATWPRFAEPRDAYAFLREAVGVPYYLVRPLRAADPLRAEGRPAAGSGPPPRAPPA